MTIIATFERCNLCYLIHFKKETVCKACSNSVQAKSYAFTFNVRVCKSCCNAYTDWNKVACCGQPLREVPASELMKDPNLVQKSTWVLQDAEKELCRKIEHDFSQLTQIIHHQTDPLFLNGFQHAEIEKYIESCTSFIRLIGDEQTRSKFELQIAPLRKQLPKLKLLNELWNRLDNDEEFKKLNAWLLNDTTPNQSVSIHVEI